MNTIRSNSKKRILTALLIIGMLMMMMPMQGFATGTDVQAGAYLNSDYNSSVILSSDKTFIFKVNFGEGFENLSGTWTASAMDTGEIGITLTVTSKHIGLTVEPNYSFTTSDAEKGVLYLSDGEAGIIPADTAFKYDASTAPATDMADPVATPQTTASTVNTVSATDISEARGHIQTAAKTRISAMASELLTALSSGHTYTGYRGLVLDKWAEKEVGIADAMGVMPVEVNDYFHEDITRDDFAALVYSALLKVTGMTESQLNSSVTLKTFSDCSNTKVSVCAGLGIITGDPAGTFRPSDNITRQEAAAMLSRLAETVGLHTNGTAVSFTDVSGLWGESYIKNVSMFKDAYTGNAVMAGTGNNKFSPKGIYSRQQAVATIVRMLGTISGSSGAEVVVSTNAAVTAEQISAAAKEEVSKLASDGTFTDSDILAMFTYFEKLKTEGTITSLSEEENRLSYAAADGQKCEFVVATETDASGNAIMGCASDINSSEMMVNETFVIKADRYDAALADKLYMGNNNVLFLSAFSASDTIYSTPFKSIISDLKEKGYNVTEKYNAGLDEFASMGTGSYGMIIVHAHGLCNDNGKVSIYTEINKSSKSYGGVVSATWVERSADGTFKGVKSLHAMSSDFFKYNARSGAFDDTYVHFISCQSMMGTDMANTFINLGAKAITGYSDSVSVSYATKALDTTVIHMTEATDNTVPEIDIEELLTAVTQMCGLDTFTIPSYNEITKKDYQKQINTIMKSSGTTTMILGVEPVEEEPEVVGDAEQEVRKVLNLLLAGDKEGYLAALHPDTINIYGQQYYNKMDSFIAQRDGTKHSMWSHKVVNVEYMVSEGIKQILMFDGKYFNIPAVDIDVRLTFECDEALDTSSLPQKYACGCPCSYMSGFNPETNQATRTIAFYVDPTTGKVIYAL